MQQLPNLNSVLAIYALLADQPYAKNIARFARPKAPMSRLQLLVWGDVVVELVVIELVVLVDAQKHCKIIVFRNLTVRAEFR